MMFSKQVQTKLIPLLLVVGLLSGPLPALAATQALSGDVSITVAPVPVDKSVAVPGADTVINLAFRNVSIGDALRALAKKGGFNVIVDESVQGNITVDLRDITIRDALETLKTFGNLTYATRGTSLMAATTTSERGHEFSRTDTKIIPLRYANALVVADLMNTTVFRMNNGGGQAGTQQTAKTATADFQTNSLIIVGTQSDIQVAQEYIQALDTPRESRTWRLSHADALDVAQMLSASLFNEGVPIITSGGAGGGQMGSASGANSSGPLELEPASLNVRSETIKEGKGATEKSSQEGDEASVIDDLTVRTSEKKQSQIQIAAKGALIIPDTRLNAVTLMGTAEQIAMAEALMPVMDRKAPQVVLEASLIEVSDRALKEFGVSAGSNQREFGFGFNNTNDNTSQLINNAFGRNTGLSTSVTNPYEALFQFTTKPIVSTSSLVHQVNALVNNRKAKVLANPTITTIHDNEAAISIVDEVVRTVKLTLTTLAGPPTVAGTEATIGDVGIVLNILPKIGADGTISLRVRPTISDVKQRVIDVSNNIVTLLNRREILAQNVTMREGESFVLGGLVSETDSNILNQIPGASRLPILGALARSSVRNKSRSELLVVITPHIIREEFTTRKLPDATSPATYESARTGADAANAMVPVSNTPTSTSASDSKFLSPLKPVSVINTFEPGMMMPDRVLPETKHRQEASDKEASEKKSHAKKSVSKKSDSKTIQMTDRSVERLDIPEEVQKKQAPAEEKPKPVSTETGPAKTPTPNKPAKTATAKPPATSAETSSAKSREVSQAEIDAIIQKFSR